MAKKLITLEDANLSRKHRKQLQTVYRDLLESDDSEQSEVPDELLPVLTLSLIHI